ncbi:hypothetical protein JVX93_21840 [Mycolicibacterium boenickei]|nr:hypothetical protein JVX93_21840 [Mycolicibacterium boenickei]
MTQPDGLFPAGAFNLDSLAELAARPQSEWEAMIRGQSSNGFEMFLSALFGPLPADLREGIEFTRAVITAIVRKLLALPGQVWDTVEDAFESLGEWVVTIPALVGGLLNAAMIPLLDASKIATGLFPISRIGDLQDTLDALDNAIDSIPGGQALIDKICNALGVSGTGHTVTDVYNALFAIPGGNIGSPIGAINVPGIDASKIITGTIAQSFLNITNVAASWITGTLSGANIPLLDQSKVNGLGTIASNASSAQGNWTSWLSGGAWTDIGESVADFLGTKSEASDAHSTAYQTLTSIYNKIGGNNEPTASSAQAELAMQTLAGTIGQLSTAITEMRNILDGANGFSSSVSFRQPETTPITTAGAFSYTAPSWFNTATDFLDIIVCGAGGGGGGGLSDDSSPGTDSVFKANGVTKVTGAGGAAVGPGPGGGIGASPGNQTYLDILYQGGAGGANTQPGTRPGGGGGGGNFFGVIGKGGNAGAWGTTTLGPGATTAPFTGTVGAGGAGTSGGFGAREGGDGCVWVRARAALPSSFTSMGTLLLPTWKLNTGIALTDAMTAAATWSRVPPGGSSGGHILIIRANTAFTTYVYLWVKTVGGVTNYELGRVSSGTKSAWKTGTISEAVPFNAFSLTSDAGYIYTVGINGTPFDSYDDTAAHASSMGASYRSGGWGSSDSAAPGSIIQFAFLDTGTPSRIVSASVATAQAPASTGAYVDLATTGPSVTLNVPPSGEMVVDISAALSTATNLNVLGYMGFVLSGANTLAAADSRAAYGRNPTAGVFGTITRQVHLTGLNPGTTTVKAVFKHSAAAATFSDRNIIADPRP